MPFFWVWLIVVIIATALVIVGVSWYYSKRVLQPLNHRVPLSVFPDQFHLPFENVAFDTKDGLRLRGWFIPAEGSEKTVILLHGWGNNRGDTLAATHFLHEAGFNLLYFDFRACGESAGAVSTVGYLETNDAEAALEYLAARKPECSQSVGLYGISMGASVAIYCAARHPEIKCVAAEGTFDSYEKVVGRWAWINIKIPHYPFVPLSLFFVRMKLGADPEAYSPASEIAKISPRPIFFIHGSHDNLVPVKDARKLFDKAGEPKEMWVVAGAAHAKCAETGGAEYRQRLCAFFTKNL